MSRALTLLLGRAHSGRSAALRAMLAGRQSRGERAILIVPEQYTFEAERTLSGALGGLLGVEVTSFERLSERVLALSGQTKPFLSAQGCRMVIKRAALLRQDALTTLSRAASLPGFADEMHGLFSDFKRSGLTPADLRRAAQQLEGHAALQEKLTDAATLYQDAEDYLAARYLTADDAMREAVALLPGSFVKGVPVYIDEIDRPNAQLYALLSALLDAALDVTVALRVDRSDPPDAELFAPDALVYERLCALACSRGIPVRTVDCAPLPKQAAPALSHLEQNLFACPAAPFFGEPEGLTLFGASNRVREVEALACAVEAAARGGVRYREMAVIMSDPDAYAFLIGRAFSQRGVPYFLDRKRPITGHAATDATLSAVRAVAGGYAASDVLRLVKTGYTGADPGDAEELELYLTRTGLTGGALKKPFTGARVPEGAERARAAVMEPLERLRAGFSRADVAGKTRALYDYLTELRLSEQLFEQAEALRAAGRVDRMEEHAQVWRVLTELFDQLHHILGDASMSGKAYVSVLEEGLSGCSIGVIPGTADAVLLGDFARTRSRTVRALFLVGCNEGLLPAAHTDDSFLSDAELTLLSKLGLPVWNSTAQRAAIDRLDIYSAFTRATEALWIGYAFTGDGAELAPSPLVQTLRAIYPQLTPGSDLDRNEDLPLSPADGAAMLARDLSAYYAGASAGRRVPSLQTALLEQPAFSGRIKRLLAACARRGQRATLSASLATTLYDGAKAMSASRLELFNSCPYKHFIRYGLRAADEKLYEEKASDLGSFYHAALERFIRMAGERNIDWKALSDSDVDALMDELLPELIATHNDGIFLSNMRLRATLFLLVDTLKASARAIARQLGAGTFTPLSAECRFGANLPFPPLSIETPDGERAHLSGTIDRIDTARIENETYYRVVDYKTGGKKLELSDVLSGLSLQLPLYLAAAAHAGTGRAGLYYMALSPAPPDDAGDPAAEAAAAFRLSGLTLSDPSVVLASDADIETQGATVLDGVRVKDKRYTGSLCTAQEMRTLIDRALAVAGASVSDMRKGRICAEPSEKACAWCEYQSVCRFDPSLPGCRVKKRRAVARDEFFTDGGAQA